MSSKCSHAAAIERLIRLWTARCIDDPDFPLQCSLSDFLTPAVIHAVRTADMFRELDPDIQAARIAELHRPDRELLMIKGWLSDRKPVVLQ
jgi:hypothetical protein